MVSQVITPASRFSLEGKYMTALGFAILLYKDRVTGTYSAENKGCTLFRGDDKALMVDAIKTYHLHDWCGEFLRKAA